MCSSKLVCCYSLAPVCYQLADVCYAVFPCVNPSAESSRAEVAQCSVPSNEFAQQTLATSWQPCGLGCRAVHSSVAILDW